MAKEKTKLGIDLAALALAGAFFLAAFVVGYSFGTKQGVEDNGINIGRIQIDNIVFESQFGENNFVDFRLYGFTLENLVG